MPQVLLFQHTAGEPAGLIDSLLVEWEVPFDNIRLWETNEVPRRAASHLIFLGGSMSVNDEKEFPFLAEEKALIRQSVKTNIAILGLCLGAQLIASACRSPVFPCSPETGWNIVKRVPDAADTDPFPDQFRAFQFHNETFEIPDGGRLVCTGKQVRNQGFRFDCALALQFHPEITRRIIEDWCWDLRKSARAKILQDTERYLPESTALCRALLSEFLGIKM